MKQSSVLPGVTISTSVFVTDRAFVSSELGTLGANGHQAELKHVA